MNKLIITLITLIFCLVTGINAQTEIDGTIDNDTTLSEDGSPYIVNGGLNVSITGILRVEPGVIIKFNNLSTPASININGSIILNGTNTNPIVFTSIDDDSYGGDTEDNGSTEIRYWNKINFLNGNDYNIENVIFRYGGNWYSGDRDGVVNITTQEGQTVNIRNCEFFDSFISDGVPSINLSGDGDVIVEQCEFNGGYSAININNSDDVEIINNDITNYSNGIFFNNSSPTISNNGFHDISEFAFIQNGVSLPVYNNNDLSGTTKQAIRLSGYIDDGYNITLSNPMGFPYITYGWGTRPTAQLTIPGGTIFKLANLGSTCILNFNGQTAFQGTTENPIVFTSIDDDSYGGDTEDNGSTEIRYWNKINFLNGNDYNIENVIFRYGGNWYSGDRDGVVNITTQEGQTVNIRNCEFLDIYSGDNMEALKLLGTGTLTLFNNNFINCQKGVFNYSDNTLSAIENYWGDSSGPFHESLNPEGNGCLIGDNIDFTPWLTQPPVPKNDYLFPIVKFYIDQDGTKGLVAANDILGFFTGVSTAKNLGEFILSHNEDLLVKTLTDLLLDAAFEEEPKFMSICLKVSQNPAGNFDNSDVVYLMETEDQLVVGIPFKASYKQIIYDGEHTDIVPPIVGLIENYYKDYSKIPTSIYDFYTVGNAYKEMTPIGPKFDKEFHLNTIGIVDSYTETHGEKYIILKQIEPINYWFMYDYDISFVAIKCPLDIPVPEVGSIIWVEGHTKRLDYVIHQSYTGEWVDNKVVQIIVPENMDILFGYETESPTINKSLIEIRYTKEIPSKTFIGLVWPDGSTSGPDITIQHTSINVTPNIIDDAYSPINFNFSIKNQGDIEGSFTITTYSLLEDNSVSIIDERNISELSSGGIENVSFTWNPSSESIAFTPFVNIYFKIDNVSPRELITTNNIDYFEITSFYNYNWMAVTSFCPVTLELYSPSGDTINIESDSLINYEYIVDDFDNNTSIDNRIIVYNKAVGKYNYYVRPLLTAEPTDTFRVELNNPFTKDTLIDNKLIIDETGEPYIIEVNRIDNSTTIDLGKDTISCMGNSIILDAGLGFDKYVWSTGDTTQSITVSESDKYSVSVEYFSNIYYDTINIIFNNLPDISIGNDTTLSENSELLLDAGIGYSSYDWNTGVTDYKITVSGLTVGDYEYYVLVTDENGCSNSDTILISVSIENAITNVIENHTIQIYPNPANDVLYIKSDGAISNIRISLFDDSGKLLHDEELENLIMNVNHKIDISSFKSGIYLLRLNNSESIEIKKVIKQ